MQRLTILTFIFVFFSYHAMAENWERQINGLDGITITCANANKEKYAARMCKNMLRDIEAKFQNTAISVRVLGSYFVKTKTAPPKPASLANPLNIVVYVRGTHSSNILAIHLRSRISVSYEHAIEAGSEGETRSGELVLWEGSTTGAGPRKPLLPAITKAAIKKLSKQLTEIIAAWPKVNQ